MDGTKCQTRSWSPNSRGCSIDGTAGRRRDWEDGSRGRAGRRTAWMRTTYEGSAAPERPKGVKGTPGAVERNGAGRGAEVRQGRRQDPMVVG